MRKHTIFTLFGAIFVLALLVGHAQIKSVDSPANFRGLVRLVRDDQVFYAAGISEDMSYPTFVNRFHILLALPNNTTMLLRPTSGTQQLITVAATASGTMIVEIASVLLLEFLPAEQSIRDIFRSVAPASETRLQFVTIIKFSDYYEILIEEPCLADRRK